MNFLIGIDLDSHNQLQLLKRFFNAKQIARVEAKQTQHGYHFRIFKRASIRQNLQTRYYLGDCRGRMAWDESKIYQLDAPEWFDTLFEGKATIDQNFWKFGSKWHFESDFNALSLPFFSFFPARKISIKRKEHRRCWKNEYAKN